MDYIFPKQTGFYRGKVRDVFYFEDRFIMMLASDRISAFDVILPRSIPFKGQVLNQIAAYMLEACRDICPNWLLETPAPNVSLGLQCVPFKIEMVVRGNLAGHAWRTYSSGKRILCGATFPDGLKENDLLPSPVITPSTKADEGHDEDISPDEIVQRGLCTAEELDIIMNYALGLFNRGRNIAEQRQLLLVDTKYEFGKIGDTIYLMDEIHTPDSSRYFFLDGFEERQRNNEKQPQLSKEFVREWLIKNDFMGRTGDKIPEMTDEWVQIISEKYIGLYEKLTGLQFKKQLPTEEEVFLKMKNAIERQLR